MVSQSEIDREANETGLDRLICYRRILARKELARSPGFRQSGYRHLLK
jgi:hypothetical protein